MIRGGIETLQIHMCSHGSTWIY